MFTKQAILNKMRELQYPTNEYWITAGAGLVLHGVKPETKDIDMGCSSLLAETLIQKGATWHRLEDGTIRIEIDGSVEMFVDWFVDEIIQIEGVSVASLDSIRKQKAELNREKDWEDIRLIDQFVHKR